MKTGSKLATLALSSGLAVAGFTGIASPAHAADTTATFTITTGGLTLTVPTSTVALATVGTGALTASGQLGSVTVDDTRGALVNSWTTSVTSTAFSTGTSTAGETVAEPNVAYSSGAATAHSGLGTFAPGTNLLGPAYAGAAGNSSTTWNPTVAFTLQSSQVAGTYTGTITHSVA